MSREDRYAAELRILARIAEERRAAQEIAYQVPLAFEQKWVNFSRHLILSAEVELSRTTLLQEQQRL